MNNAELARAKQFKTQSRKLKKFHGADSNVHHENLTHNLLLYKMQLKQALAKQEASKIDTIKDKMFVALAEQTAHSLHAYQEHYNMVPEEIQKQAIQKYTRECAIIELFIQKHQNQNTYGNE